MSEDIEIVDMQKEAEYSRDLLDVILNTEQGSLKKVASAGSNMIKRRLRENGFNRRILPFLDVDDSDLTYLPNSELPAIVEEMEPESPGATTLAFNQQADIAFYRADKFVTYFSKISTPDFVKNVDELRTNKAPLREVITDNALKDVQTEEDDTWIAYCDRIVGTGGVMGAVGAIGESGFQQHFHTAANITRDSYTDSTAHLKRVPLNNGVFLLNQITALEWLKFGRIEAGGDLSQELLLKGLDALVEGEFMGVKHIFTIKREVVADQSVYQFAEPGSLGRAYVLQPVRMYVKKEKDILTISADEKIGRTIANVRGVQLQKFAVNP
jgi:hypothetical protein